MTAETDPPLDPAGTQAQTPTAIPWRGWRAIGLRVINELSQDRVSLIAAGVGFFALLAAFPALAAGVSLLGLLLTPTTIAQWIRALGEQLPAAVQDTLLASIGDIANQPSEQLGVAAAIGIAAALWSSRKGVKAVMQATNLAYEEQESRAWWRSLLLSLLFTIGSMGLFAIVLALGIALPLWVRSTFEHSLIIFATTALQCAVLWLCGAAGLSLLYRYAPDRAAPQWRWVSVGAAVATTLWMTGSVLFGYYVKDASSYEETYGSLAGVVITMLWLYLTGFSVILGAEINAEIEHQTAADTTVGPDKPMGERDAYVADHVAGAPDTETSQ